MNPMVRTLKTLTGLFAAAVLGLGLSANTPARASIITYGVTGTANQTLNGLTGTNLTGTITFNNSTLTSTSNTLDFETLTGWTFSSYTATDSVVSFGASSNAYQLNLSLTNAISGSATESSAANPYCTFFPSACTASITATVTPIAAPAPASWLMMLTGLGLLAPLYRRYKRGRKVA